MRRCEFTAATLIIMLLCAPGAHAQKPGGILRLYDPDSPASMSILEEATISERPMMGVFNNLVIYDQHVTQNSLQLDHPRSRDRAGRGTRTAPS